MHSMVQKTRSAVCLLAILACAAAVSAQEFRSTLSGRVIDQQDAVVPGVTVAATQIQTGARTETVSGADGQYTLPFLLPGTYRLSTEVAGFKRYVREGISVSANERLAIDIPLEVGQIADSVTVTADSSMLETATGSVGQVITQSQVENIPMNGRSPLMMAQLWAGVIPQGGPLLARPFDVSHTSDFSMSGAPSQNNELLMDGAPNSIRVRTAAYNPPMDAVLELKVEAFQSDAAFGHTGGGTVNLVSRAGTNQFHGGVSEYNQVGRLAATPFFVNRAGQRKPFMLWNQYGFTLGGPVVVPKVINGKNKLFFFYAFEGIRQPGPLALTDTVPTEAERRGDFARLLSINSNYQIYDPASGVREGARVRRSPFPNNIIPTPRLSPIALKLLQYFPLPNQSGGVDGANNLFTNAPQMDRFDNNLGRLDYNVSASHKIFFSFRESSRNSTEQSYFHNIARGRQFFRDSWGTTLDDVMTLNPTTVLNVRLNWTRFAEMRRLLSSGLDMTTLGFSSTLAKASSLPVLPMIEITRFAVLGESNHNITPFDSFQIFPNLVKVRNKHNLKLGADLRLMRESDYKPRYSSGRYTYNANWTRGPLDTSSTAPLGQELASFLLGLPTGGQFDVNSFRSSQSAYYAIFFQDDFRAARNLTLNLGVRYERETPTTERFDRQLIGFDTAANTSVTAKAKAAYALSPIPEVPVSQFNPVGGLLFASSSNRNPYTTFGKNFSPRVGVAWTPAGARNVIRGGIGVFYFDLGITALNQTGFSQSTSLVATQDGYLTPYATFSNYFPDGIQQPLGASQGIDTYLGQGVAWYNNAPKNPYSLRWNLSVQRLITPELVLEIGYIGNRSNNLGVDQQYNFVPAKYLSTAPTRDQANIDFLATQVKNPFAGLIPGTNLNSATVARTQLLYAIPQFTGVTQQSMNLGNSISHTLLARLERRMRGGLQMQASMQYSRIIQELTRLNNSDVQLERRVAPEDRPLRGVVSGTYALPFGRGRRFAAGGRALNQVAGGWSLNGVYIWQSGPAVEWGDMIYFGGDLKWNAANIDRVFDTTRFNTDSRLQRSQSVRTFPSAFSGLRADSVSNLDLSAIKDFPILESLKLQYRCEFFNALNHPVFGGPDVSATSSTFGRTYSQANQARRIQMALRLIW